MTMCDLNSPISCDNIIFASLVGCKTIYTSFCKEEENFKYAIENYFNSKSEESEVKEDCSNNIDIIK